MTFLPWPPISSLIPGCRADRGLLATSSTRACGTVEREPRFVLAGHPPDDLEVLGQDLHPLAQRRVGEAERARLVLLEAGAQAERQPTAGDRVQRGGGLGRHRGVVERRVEDDQARSRPAGQRRETRRQRPAVERDRLARPLREDVLAGPDRLEAESLGRRGELDDPVPGAARLPALELVEVALRQDQSDLHRSLRARRSRAANSIPAARTSSISSYRPSSVSTSPGTPQMIRSRPSSTQRANSSARVVSVAEVGGHDRRDVLLAHHPLACRWPAGPDRARPGWCRPRSSGVAGSRPISSQRSRTTAIASAISSGGTSMLTSSQ